MAAGILPGMGTTGTRPRPSLTVEAKAAAVHEGEHLFDEAKHPRDKHGRFISIGAHIDLGDGRVGKVTHVAAGEVTVARDDGKTVTVKGDALKNTAVTHGPSDGARAAADASAPRTRPTLHAAAPHTPSAAAASANAQLAELGIDERALRAIDKKIGKKNEQIASAQNANRMSVTRSQRELKLEDDLRALQEERGKITKGHMVIWNERRGAYQIANRPRPQDAHPDKETSGGTAAQPNPQRAGRTGSSGAPDVAAGSGGDHAAAAAPRPRPTLSAITPSTDGLTKAQQMAAKNKWKLPEGTVDELRAQLAAVKQDPTPSAAELVDQGMSAEEAAKKAKQLRTAAYDRAYKIRVSLQAAIDTRIAASKSDKSGADAITALEASVKRDLTPDERSALMDYVGGGYRKLNRSLRDGGSLTPDQQATTDTLQRLGQEHALHDDLILHRGIDRDATAAFGDIGTATGTEFTDRGFGSTTLQADRAASWAGTLAQSRRNDSAVLQIHAPRGTPALPVEQLLEGRSGIEHLQSRGRNTSGQFGSEEEVVLMPGARLRVTSDSEQDGHRVIVAEVVPNGSSTASTSAPTIT